MERCRTERFCRGVRSDSVLAVWIRHGFGILWRRRMPADRARFSLNGGEKKGRIQRRVIPVVYHRMVSHGSMGDSSPSSSHRTGAVIRTARLRNTARPGPRKTIHHIIWDSCRLVVLTLENPFRAYCRGWLLPIVGHIMDLALTNPPG